MIIKLKYVNFEINPSAREVRTIFPDGITCCGTRDVTPANVREARSQGYEGSDELVVWRSLVEHELLHSLVAECIFDRHSLVLRTEGGGEFYPSWLRYEEEMLAIGWQAFSNGLGYGPLMRYSVGELAIKWEDVSLQLAGLWAES